MKNNKKAIGRIGEEIAADYLKENGFYVLAQNYKVGRIGEIDIIAREKEYICFIEVKTRTNTAFGVPSEAVNKRKQQQIAKIAYIYMDRYNLHNESVRFDVIEVTGKGTGDDFVLSSINHIKNAFSYKF